MKLARSPSSAPGFLAWVDSTPRSAALFAVLLSLFAIAWLDVFGGKSPVQHLYYAPIVFAAVRFKSRLGFLVTLAAIALYHLANPPAPSIGFQEADLLQSAVFFACYFCSRKLAHDARHLAQLAVTDDLTGLSNLRGFEAGLRLLLESAMRDGGPVTLLLADADRLKSINDVHGHLAGADAVCHIGSAIARIFPAPAISCRYGGDEFAIALPIGPAEASHQALALRDAIRSLAPAVAGHLLPRGSLTVSIGLCSRTFAAGSAFDAAKTGELMFHSADKALYAAKHEGRDRLVSVVAAEQ